MAAKSKNSLPAEIGSPPGGLRPKLPPLKALLAFDAAARLGSFAQGAEELGVTPSAVSHQLQLLEDFLGLKLFRRHAGRAILTPAGGVYATEINNIFALLTTATQRVAPQSQRGHLVIAASPSFAAKWLQPRLPAFLGASGDTQVRLTTVSTHEDLDRDRCDVAIVYGQPPPLRGEVEALLVERLCPLCSPALAASAGLREPGDLARATLIHSVNALTWSEFLRRIGRSEVRAKHELWLDRSSMAIEAAVSALGVVLESELLAEQELRDGRLIAPFDSETFGVDVESYFLVRPAGFKNRPQVARFEAWLRASLAGDLANAKRRTEGKAGSSFLKKRSKKLLTI